MAVQVAFFGVLTQFLISLASWFIASLLFRLLGFFTVVTVSMFAFDYVLGQAVSLFNQSEFLWLLRRMGVGEALGVISSAYALRFAAPIYWGLKGGDLTGSGGN